MARQHLPVSAAVVTGSMPGLTEDHGPRQHHFDDMAQQNESAALGMWLFLLTELMFFGGVFTAYDQPLTGLDPAWLMESPSGQHAVTSSPVEYATWRALGWSDDGIAFYTVRFPNAVPEPSTWGLALAGLAGGLLLMRRRRGLVDCGHRERHPLSKVVIEA